MYSSLFLNFTFLLLKGDFSLSPFYPLLLYPSLSTSFPSSALITPFLSASNFKVLIFIHF